MKIFDKKNVIITKIDEDDLLTFLLKMDIDDNNQPLYPLEVFTQEIMQVIPEYVFAQYEDPTLSYTGAVDKLREAANTIYKIKEFDLLRTVYLSDDATVKLKAQQELATLPYKNRGEFGELLLHFLLRDFKGTIPLISKVYFKDSNNVPAHGFDAVHISPNEKILWLGESKLYSDGKEGIKALLDDLNKHLKTEYIDDQFVLIAKNLKNNSIPQREYWIKEIAAASSLREKLSFINIPILCVYEHDIYDRFADTTLQDAADYHEMNVRELKKYFDDKNTNHLKDRCNIVLLLFPVKSKNDLVKKLHERLWHMQSM